MTRIVFALLFPLFCLPGHAWAQAASIRLTVEDAIARGLANSHRIAEARAREDGAQAAVRSAQLANRPAVSALAGYTRTNHVPIFAIPQNGRVLVVYPDIPDNFSTRLAFEWPIYNSGRFDALERAAEAEANAAAADIETTRSDLRFEIVRAYWAAITAREAVRVLEESTTRAELQLTDIRQRFNVGLVPPNEVSSLEAQHSRERAQLIEASNFRESTLIELRRLIDLEPNVVIEFADTLDPGTLAGAAGATGAPSADALIREALQQRPERKALSLRLGGIEARQDAAAKANKPALAFNGGWDYAKPNSHIFPRQGEWQESWDLSVNVNWPFFDSGRTRSQVTEAAAAADAARARLAELDTVVAADVRQRVLDLDSSLAQVQASSDAVRSAAEARRVVGDRFAAGVATSTDVIVAQVALLENELARTRALANVRLAEARLHRALGRP